jgi:hypothetical protein
VRIGRRHGTVGEHEALGQRGDVGSVLCVQPRDPTSLLAGHEAGAADQSAQLGIDVADEHLDRSEDEDVDRLEGATPEAGERNGSTP